MRREFVQFLPPVVGCDDRVAVREKSGNEVRTHASCSARDDDFDLVSCNISPFLHFRLTLSDARGHLGDGLRLEVSF